MILSSITQKWIDAYLNRPSTTLLIDSPGNYDAGVEIARSIYEKLIQTKGNPLLELQQEKENSIGVDDIRELIKKLSLKANSGSGVQRVMLINKADTMTPQAQNSLLKLIEELPKGTIIIMVVKQRSALLDTVLSRCFIIPILPINKEQASKYGQENNITQADIDKAYILSDGQPKLFENILQENETELLYMIDIARSYLSKNTFARQADIKNITDKNFDFIGFLQSIKIISKSAMRNAKTTESKYLWKKRLQFVIKAQLDFSKSVPKKLILLNLSINL